jgi:HEAT repeat protein
MLPVFIKDELDDQATPAGLTRLTEAIRGKLQALVGSAEPISPELLKYLLWRWRVLVIIDHLTEMSQATQDQIRFDAAEFPAAALVVTARTDVLGNHPKHTIEPMRIEGKRLSMFLDAYLNERKKRDLFDDEEYFDACLQLSRMTGERDVTALLAKLYADQMVAAKESPDGDELPKTIPDLMLRYLNELNRNTGGEDNRTVQRDCKAVAWECLKTSYRPVPAERTAVIAALKDDGEDERAIAARLDYLIKHLRVIQVSGAAEDHIRFALDPLAEYLAGLQVVEEYQGRGTRQKWERFLREADRMPGAPEAIRGFLLAVRDCCLASKSEVPDFVPEELGKRGSLDPELVQQLQLKQRVRHYMSNLDLPHADDRAHAASALGGIGPVAKDAVPGLVKLLHDPDENVRRAAADALGGIGPAAVPGLAKLLHDPDGNVRGYAASALSRIGPAAEAAVPALAAALKDADAEVRWWVADALKAIGPASVPALTAALKDADAGMRRLVTSALQRIGPASSDTT